MIVARDDLAQDQPPAVLAGPFYVIRYVKKLRRDARRPWTPENTRYCTEQWYEVFDDLAEAQHTNQIESLAGHIYRVEAL